MSKLPNGDTRYLELTMIHIRKPAVAGSFYPKKGGELRVALAQYLDNVTYNFSLFKKPKIVIVPHAGYIYSGQTAAYAYRLIGKFSYKEIILIGPAHFYPIAKQVTADFALWETPLGKITVDNSLNRKLHLEVCNYAFRDEHSLEVQLPFLQFIYANDFCFYPILINEYKEEFSQKLASCESKNTLFIVSSDLSHYFPQAEAEGEDKKTIASTLNQKLDGKIDACGKAGIQAAISLAQNFGLDGQLLHYDTSATTSGDISSVVGYAAISFS